MAGTVRSLKNIWSVLAENSILKHPTVIGQLLQDHSKCLCNGLLYYKKPSDASLAELKNKLANEVVKFEFIKKFSKLIGVDALQCYDLFISYVHYEYKGTASSLEASLSIERHEQVFLFEMWNFYYNERLYALLTLKHILEHWHDCEDNRRVLYKGFMECMDKNRSILKLIMAQMESFQNDEIPSLEDQNLSINLILAQNWASTVLKEQCELLQLVLLYYKHKDPTLSEVQRLFSICQRHAFGFGQSFRQHITEENLYLVDMMWYLETFAIMQTLRLDLFCNLDENTMDLEHYLLNDEDVLNGLSETILAFSSLESHAPTLLSWMLLARCTGCSRLLKYANKLGEIATQLGVFDYIAKTMTFMKDHHHGEVSVIIHSIVYNLMYLVFAQFEIKNLGPSEAVLKIVFGLLKIPSITEDFWQKGMERGLGILVMHCTERFPVEFNLVIDIMASLAEAGTLSSTNVLKFIKNLPVIMENCENIDSDDIAATPNSSMFVLLRDRILYEDPNLVIKQGTYGYTLNETENQVFMRWQTSVNGWQICLRELYLILKELSTSVSTVSIESLTKVMSIANLLHNLLKTDLYNKEPLRHITNVLFSILERLTTHPSPPMDIIAKCFDIAYILYSLNPTIWMTLVQMNFLPTVLNISEDLFEMASGLSLNMGVLGELILTKECALGQYPLCISFLKLLVRICENVTDESANTFVGCVLFILREIFCNIHKWGYLDPQDKMMIGRTCMSFFHSLFCIETPDVSKIVERASKICIVSLLYHEAGQTLLRIVCTGEETIQRAIVRQNSFIGDQIACLIRLSLSVLNRLLLLRHHVVEENQQEMIDQSPFEKVVFSISGSYEQPQIVLTVAKYAYQHYNPHLATLAVQLLKRFAKEFPMSLLASFGSEAEAIRDHFLSRLNSPREDIRLKVSIMEFLTVCINHQPGLIEMFINVKVGEKVDIDKGCLNTVQVILKDSPDKHGNYYQELQCVAVEFVHAVWFGHQGLAMDAFKKNPDFWNNLCSTLLNEHIDKMHPRIIAYTIRTLALELFYISSTVGCSLVECGIKTIMTKVCSEKLLEKWSEYVNGISLKEDFSMSYLDIHDRSMADEEEDTFALYSSWRDFLLVFAKSETLLGWKIPAASKLMILNNILTNLRKQITGENLRLMSLLSELYTMLFSRWKEDFTMKSQETLDSMQELFFNLCTNADVISPRVQLAIVSMAAYTVNYISRFKDKDVSTQLKEWIMHVCKLLRKSTSLIDRSVKNEQAVVLKLPVAIISLLTKLIEETTHWLPVLKSHMIIPLLLSLLTKCLKMKAAIRLALSIVTFLITISSNNKAAEMLCDSGFMGDIILALSSVKIYGSESKTVYISKKLSLEDVYYAFVRLLRDLLHCRGNYFLQDALNFIGVHLENVHNTFEMMQNEPLSMNLNNVSLTCSFLYQLSFHQQIWHLQHPLSIQILLADVCCCIHWTIALLMRPGLLRHCIEQKGNPNKALLLPEDKIDMSTQRTSCSEDEPAPSEKLIKLQTELYDVLANCLATVQRYSPGFYETVTNHRIDHAQWQAILDMSFQAPALEQGGTVSCGDMLACANTCLQELAKNDRMSSPSKNENWQVPKNLLVYVLEGSLSLLVTQCSLALTHPEIQDNHKQMIRRELSSELNLVIQAASWYIRKGTTSPATTPLVPFTSTSTPQQRPTPPRDPELPFLKLINNLVMGRLVK